MKKSYTTILALLLAVFISINAFSQDSYDLQFRLEDDGSVSGFYEVTAQIKANVSGLKMGSSNLVFTYDPAALTSPDPIGPGPDSLQLQAIHNFSGGGVYNKLRLTEPAAGRLSLNIELYNPTEGADLPMSFVDVATIRFTINNPATDPALTWRTASPNPLTVFVDDEATIVDYNTLAAEVLLADLKVFLQGPYSGSGMSTALNTGGYIPLSQPFNTAPWNYAGTESVGAIPTGVVDWVLLQLRSNETTVVDSRAGFIKSDGMIVDLNGTSPVTFDVPDNSYYVAVYHRNHLAIMNAIPMNLNEAAVETEYDFTTGQSQAYGTAPLVELGTGSGIFGMIGGETNLTGIITNADKSPIVAELNQVGYYTSDVNFTGIVTNADKSLIISNLNKFTQVPTSSDNPNGNPQPANHSKEVVKRSNRIQSDTSLNNKNVHREKR